MPATKRPQPPKQKKEGLTSFRWSVGFDKKTGAVVAERAAGKSMAVGVWLREAALERLAREDAGKPSFLEAR